MSFDPNMPLPIAFKENSDDSKYTRKQKHVLREFFSNAGDGQISNADAKKAIALTMFHTRDNQEIYKNYLSFLLNQTKNPNHLLSESATDLFCRAAHDHYNAHIFEADMLIAGGVLDHSHEFGLDHKIKVLGSWLQYNDEDFNGAAALMRKADDNLQKCYLEHGENILDITEQPADNKKIEQLGFYKCMFDLVRNIFEHAASPDEVPIDIPLNGRWIG